MPSHRTSRAALACSLVAVIQACGGGNTPSQVQAPGEPQAPATTALEAGADVLQAKSPVRALNAYLDGFHFYNGNLAGQVEAHHYCSLLNEDLTQCVIFDGNAGDAKIMGVEYIVSARLFATLPREEKVLWHSHAHEVRSGSLVAPGIPEAAEDAFMEKMAGTYGKTWHTWHTDREMPLPTGVPLLMMGFTADGQLDARLLAERDQRFGISSADKRQRRAGIAYPAAIDPDADAWQKGVVMQVELAEVGQAQHALPPVDDPRGRSDPLHSSFASNWR